MKKIESMEIFLGVLGARLGNIGTNVKEIKEECEEGIRLFRQRTDPNQIIKYSDRLIEQAHKEEKAEQSKSKTFRPIGLRALACRILDWVISYSIILDLEKCFSESEAHRKKFH